MENTYNKYDDDDEDEEDCYREIDAKACMPFKYETNRIDLIGKSRKSLIDLKSRDIIEDQFDDNLDYDDDPFDDDDDLDYSKSKHDYILMAFHFKALCKSYKSKLLEANKRILELSNTIEHMERTKSKEKTSFDLIKFEANENMKLTIEKCETYCRKINELSNFNIEELDSNSNDTNTNKNEMILKTLQNMIKEKREIKNFFKPFTQLVKQINPNTQESNTSSSNKKIDFCSLNKLLIETLTYLNQNNLNKYHCRCNSFYDFKKQNNLDYEDEKSAFFSNKSTRNQLSSAKSTDSSASSISSSSYCLTPSSMSSVSSSKLHLTSHSNHRENSNYRHKPSPEFLLNCVDLFQNLFDVDCFLNVPTKLNELYYKFGQLQNFKNVIQNMFDPDANYTIEKLICSVQFLFKKVNDDLSSDLKALLKSNSLENVVSKFSMYNEFFPIFYKLLEQIMKTLEISRLDQIMPAIKALKILATPTLT